MKTDKDLHSTPPGIQAAVKRLVQIQGVASPFQNNCNEQIIDIGNNCKLSNLGIVWENGKLRKAHKGARHSLIVRIGNKRQALASLVAKYFVPNPEGYRNLGFVKDKTDCSAQNLYWMSNTDYYKYCRLDEFQNYKGKSGRKKIQGDRLQAIINCQCHWIREYYITLDEIYLHKAFEIGWKQIYFKHRQKFKSIIYEYFYDRCKRFSITYTAKNLILDYRKGAHKKWCEENLKPKKHISYYDNLKVA